MTVDFCNGLWWVFIGGAAVAGPFATARECEDWLDWREN
jgi:hypothetical protein